jgi:hypothetical protein
VPDSTPDTISFRSYQLAGQTLHTQAKLSFLCKADCSIAPARSTESGGFLLINLSFLLNSHFKFKQGRREEKRREEELKACVGHF